MSTGLNKKPEIGQIYEAQVEKMAIGGDGVCRVASGFVLFVPLSAPLDKLKIKVETLEDRHGTASIVEVLEPGPSRRKSPCEYAQKCGGCSWQQITEEEQRNQKTLLLKDLFKQFLPQTSVEISKIISSPSMRYRNRVQPVLKNSKLGFRMRKSHDLITVQDCLLVEDPLSPYFKQTHSQPDGRYELRLLDSGVTEMAREGESSSFSFSQVNRFQNEDLKTKLLCATAELSPQRILDLYSGSGNFTEHLAQQHPKTRVIGVEADGKLIEKAKCKKDKSKNTSYFVSEVSPWLKRNPLKSTDLVVLDPPRGGTDKASLREIAKAQVRDIIYISCHPVSLVRDLKDFLSFEPSTKILWVQPFEMFPQTDHFEIMVHLRVDSHS